MATEFRPAGWGRTLVVLTVGFLLHLAMPAPAQDVDLMFGFKPGDDNPPLKTPFLRPNIEQELFVYVKNQWAMPKKVKVQLLVNGVVFKEKEETVPSGGKPLAVMLGKPPTREAPPAKLDELKGSVAFRLLDEKGDPLGGKIELPEPAPGIYSKVGICYFEAGKEKGRNQLVIEVASTQEFGGPPCRVDLVVKPERIKGFAPNQKRLGNWGGILSGKKGELPVYLVAKDLQFEGQTTGTVYVTIDGYERAFSYDATFVQTGTSRSVEPKSGARAFVSAPEFANPDQAVKLGVELDGLLAGEVARLEMQSLKLENDKLVEAFTPVAEFKGNRNVKLLFSADGPQGGLLFKPETRDWDTPLELKGVHGDALLRLVRYRADGKGPDEIRDERLVDAGSKDRVRIVLKLDAAAPTDVKFLEPPTPKKALLGEVITLSATSADPPEDIGEVVFFVGKPLPDGKLPPTVELIPGNQNDLKKNVWTTALRVPRSGVEALDVSVRFTKKAGGTKILSRRIEVEDPNFKVAVLAKGSISGLLLEGDRPQAGIAVELRDTKDTKPDAKIVVAKTNDKGFFEFKDLDPSRYRLSAVKTASNTKAAATVDLAPGQILVLDGKKDKDGKVVNPALLLFR